MKTIKTACYTKENWEEVLDSGFLPILATKNSDLYYHTPIHMPELAPTDNEGDIEEKKDLYWDSLTRVKLGKTLKTLDILAHLSCSQGCVVMVDPKYEEYLEVLESWLRIK